MKKSFGLAALALAVALGQGLVAAPRAATAAEPSSEIVAGVVTKIDHDLVTVRSSDGKDHEFKASSETLKDLKVGDRIEAKRRAEKN